MANVTLNTTLLVRRGITTEWASSTYVLQKGELGYDTEAKVLKMGDGASLWAKLPAVNKTIVEDSATDGYIKVDGAEIQVVNLSTINTAIGNKYTKPTGGIPKSDLASAVQTSLTKADTALQSHQTITTGSTKGTIAVAGKDVAVKGLGSAAYTDSGAYATAAQGKKADAALPKADFDTFKTANTTAIADAKKAGTDASAALTSYKASNDKAVQKNATDISNLQTAVKAGITFKGKLEQLPATTAYENGDLIIVGNKEYILYADTEGTKSWIELGDEGSHLTKATADGYYVAKNASITAGTATKITYDSKGLVTGGASLAASDIPALDAAKITSGTFADARIASASKWNAKQDAITSSNKLPAANVSGLAAVATSGSYNDLSNKPTIKNENQTIIVGEDSFGVNDAVEIKAGDKISVTANTTDKSITIGVTGLGAAAVKGVVTSVDTSANLPTSGAVKTYVDTAVKNKDVGVTKVVAGTDITVSPTGGTGAVTVNHKTITTSAVATDAGNTAFLTGLTVNNGHVTGAKSNTFADALAQFSYILDGGSASGN